uniref:Right handed beta helix domain-containing protein n=1 Tax=Skeletonema marinoi TaxID=267567 RepID=A0A6U3YIX6_9STRA|mmetsp:Transcript_5642/g.9406  ORF Transcript_5642/g.9406 Transcript_5642/m.9406 type:complete len:391 (+) Transcript_5642:115-1287(+)
MEDPPPSLPTPPKRQKASSLSNVSRTAVVLFLSLGIVIGGGIVGIAGHISSRDIQQQNAVAIIREGPDNQGKAGKTPPPVCGSTVQCGQTFTGEVKLTEDLYCPQTTSGNCAITLEGEDAVLDCNQYMIDGDIRVGNGICLRNSASAINCYVQKFEDGIYVENGGEVNECEVMFNIFGIRIENEASSTTKMKISNTYIHDNGDSGIYFVGSGESPESSETSIEVNNVKSNLNGGLGMFVGGRNVKLEVQVTDSETSNNDNSGIVISKLGRSDAAVDLELDGIISRYNENFGVYVSSVTGDVKVKGDVNLYKNGLSGFYAEDANVDIVVERRGALNSCGHLATGSFDNDIGSAGVGLATFSGNGYTCDSTSPNLSDIITCDPCPTCPSDDA